jgi:hypothetical protein
MRKDHPELDSLIAIAAKTKILREVRAAFPCGLTVDVYPNGQLCSKGRHPTGCLHSEVNRLLTCGPVEITASHGVTGRVVRLGASALYT